jgi:hypothetical protein
VFPRQADVCDRCNGAVFLIKEGLDAGLAAGRLRIPEGLPMLWNVEDFSQCPDTPSNPCKAPLFSVFKFKQNLDVLMPHFKPRSLEPHYVPWEQKRELAFFRGASICSNVPLNGSIEAPRSANCSRWAVAQLSWEHPDLLNATIMFNVTEYGGPRAVEGPPTSHEEQAYYKYLLNVDGSTAAWRLATLLMKNSLVIKQASPDVEWCACHARGPGLGAGASRGTARPQHTWPLQPPRAQIALLRTACRYYHALKPCEHYIHYWCASRRAAAAPRSQRSAQKHRPQSAWLQPPMKAPAPPQSRRLC